MNKTYRVFQKAEVWYVTEVEAKDAFEAKSIVTSNDYDGDWELDLNTVVDNDEYDVWEK